MVWGGSRNTLAGVKYQMPQIPCSLTKEFINAIDVVLLARRDSDNKPREEEY